ncbi:CDP-alcohol phosphatidyltransferase family protein [Halosimplex litoreum]|uniref:CDP-alcohol phosphatidyltransferase family protein n=1 Tax=Halosimplex litoreum TaxID=1198301 RepID=A0A7U3WAZ7_9EURY|nr:CDP-alcohol phosphatidyltransferase family protein [Halosimplex litoreum]QPV64792.1 CDP-alcohol phosphatidyltransferase family protein [Halosimplex litoreum]
MDTWAPTGQSSTMDIDWRARAGEVWTVPNLISLSRLPLVAGIVLALDSPVRYVLFALVVLSDGVDGWVARRLDQTTELGALMDPALDKLTALVLVVALYPATGLDPAYLAFFFARDAFVVALVPLVPLLAFETEKVKARLPGKVVTNLQFLAMVAMLVPAVTATEALLWALAVASAVAIADYVVFVAREQTDRQWVHDWRGVAVAAAAVTLTFAAVTRLLLAEQLAEALAAL